MSLLDTDEMQSEIIRQLLGESEGTDLEKNRYIDRLVELCDLEGAEHQSLIDPFDRSVALVFQMFNDTSLDPWDLDLEVFIQIFTKRIKDAEDIDLPTCGRLIRMAWRVLQGQASTLLERAERAGEEWEEDTWYGGWETEFGDDEYNFSVGIISGASAASLPDLLDGRLKRDEGRKVTLAELLMGLQEAHEEADIRRIREAGRIKHAAEVKEWMANVTTRMHKEDLEDDIRRCWEALRAAGPEGEPVTLEQVSSQLTQHSLDEGWELKEAEDEGQIAGFVSALFLTHRGYSDLWQMEYPNGDIFLQDKWPNCSSFDDVSSEIGVGPRLADAVEVSE